MATSFPPTRQPYNSAADMVSAKQAITVTPSDTATIPLTRALYIGGGGTIVVQMANGDQITFVGAAAGILPIQVTMVYSTNTLATSIVALY